MDHKTAVMVVINAMQSDKTPDDIRKEIDTLLETVSPDERQKVLTEATKTYKRIEAGLPIYRQDS